MFNSYTKNTLEYYPAKCVGCGMCWTVCPHAVFSHEARPTSNPLVKNRMVATLVNKEACMECGACQLNCPTEAIKVQSGVGCASAMIHAALTGGSETCGDGGCGCGSPDTGSTSTDCGSEKNR